MSLWNTGQRTLAHQPTREQQALIWAARFFWVTIGLLPLLILLMAANVILALAPAPPPHIVEVDPQGRTLWVGPPGGFTVKEAWIATQVTERWIENSRRRSDDFVLMAEMRKKAERMTSGEALRDLQKYHQGTDPNVQQELKVNPIRTELSDFRVVKQSPLQDMTRTLEIHWREVWSPKFGSKPTSMLVVGVFTVEQRLIPGPFGRLLTKGYDANKSPLGVYVIRYHLNERWEEPSS